ncbi:MAG: hypothetical protein GKC53_00055 [Neisseriaceae bacterium]|nr:MAG: hypothetical protein GKC53_00055 [Neisseriaceae bacterium]
MITLLVIFLWTVMELVPLMSYIKAMKIWDTNIEDLAHEMIFESDFT